MFGVFLIIISMVILSVYGFRIINDNTYASRYNPTVTKITAISGLLVGGVGIILALVEKMG
jgi:hypothetical protein